MFFKKILPTKWLKYLENNNIIYHRLSVSSPSTYGLLHMEYPPVLWWIPNHCLPQFENSQLIAAILNKLSSNGILPKLCFWIASYISGGQISVAVEWPLISVLSINAGV